MHSYADPCATCGEPSFNYNYPKCSRCERAEKRDLADPLSRLMFPGAASVIKELRQANQDAALAAALKAQRSTTQAQVDRIEAHRDASRGSYITHQGSHHFGTESRH